MKIFVSGGSGLLGGTFIDLASNAGHDCFRFERTAFEKHSNASLEAMLCNTDYFIHAAANTNVEACEVNPSDCYKDNVLLTEKIANVARRLRIPMVYISSTGIYGDWKADAFSEYDVPIPTTHHHKSKLLGEELVLTASWDNLIIRTGWLFGGKREATKNFVAKRIEEARKSNGTIYSNNEQHGCPTFVNDVVTQILLLLKGKHRGVFNCVNEGRATRFEYVSEIISAAGLDVHVLPTPAAQFKRVAPVSNNECALNWKMGQLGFPLMPDWRASLTSYIDKIK